LATLASRTIPLTVVLKEVPSRYTYIQRQSGSQKVLSRLRTESQYTEQCSFMTFQILRKELH